MRYCVILWMCLTCSGSTLNNCQPGCKCDTRKVKCYGSIPKLIPLNSKEVHIFGAIMDKRLNFTDPSWGNVTTLLINPELSAYHNRPGEVSKDLYEFEFEGLKSLEKLQISCRCLRNVHLDAFGGLNKLKVLDLSNNENLMMNSIHNGFVSAGISNLSELYLSNSSNAAQYHEMLQVESSFFRILKLMPLEVFDISSTPAWADMDDPNLLSAFSHLQKLNVSDSGKFFISMKKTFGLLNVDSAVTSFKCLKSIDISYPGIPYEITDTVFTSHLRRSIYVNAPLELTELYAKGILKKPGNVSPVIANVTHVCILFAPEKGY